LNNILQIIASDPNIDLHLCIHKDQRTALLENLTNITTHYLDFRQGFWRLQLREQIDVPKLARKIGADVTFSPANYGPIMAPNSVLLLRNALSVAFVERRPVKLGYWALVYLATLVSLAFSRRAITVSDYARRAAGGSMAGLFNRQFEVIPHGISDIFSQSKLKRDEYLLAVSDLYVQKNLINLLRAVARIRPANRDIKLKIAGRAVDPHYFAELQRVVVDEGLTENVEFLGGIAPSELVELYRRCAVFVFPSTVETFGNPLVEAMACGAPIASSNSAAMPEVVGDAAIYFDPQDVGEMAAAISRLLSDKDLRRDLSRKATERAKQYSWDETARKTIEVIRSAASSGRDL
jgi:glycosyltransferase involved in cell wall biosynthesis